MVYIVYHSADFDGYFSALITATEVSRRNKDAEIVFVPYNYEKELKLNATESFDPEKLTIDDSVFFVDVFYRNKEWYEKAADHLKKIPCVIDHHETTYEFFKNELNFEDSDKFEKPVIYENEDLKKTFVLSSSWKDGDKTMLFSAAAMCWYYFNAPENILKTLIDEKGFVDKSVFYIPKFIELVARYDVWDKTNNSFWCAFILPFQFGLRSDSRINTKDVVKSTFTKFFYLFRKKIGDIALNDEKGECPNLIEYRKSEGEFLGNYNKTVLSGKAILAYIAERNKKLVTFGSSCKLRIEGKENGEDKVVEIENCYFASDHLNNSMLFEHGLKNYEKYAYLINVSPKLYPGSVTEKGVVSNIQIINANSDSNSAPLAQLLGGGGHKAIAGCTAYVKVTEEKEGEESKKVLTLSYL